MIDDKHSTDPVEEELHRLQPRGLSAGFAERLGQRLSEQQPSGVYGKHNIAHRPFRIWPVVAGLAAILLVAMTIWFLAPTEKPDLADPGPDKHGDPDTARPKPDEMTPQELVSTLPQNDESLPTVGSYRSAMRESPEAFDLLLEKHAEALMPPNA